MIKMKSGKELTKETYYMSLFIGIGLLIISIVSYIFGLYFFILMGVVIACGKIILDAIYSKKINDLFDDLIKIVKERK